MRLLQKLVSGYVATGARVGRREQEKHRKEREGEKERVGIASEWRLNE